MLQSRAAPERAEASSPAPWADADTNSPRSQGSQKVKLTNKIASPRAPEGRSPSLAGSRSDSKEPETQAAFASTTEAQLRRVVRQEMRDFLHFSLTRAFELQQRQLERHIDRALSQPAQAERHVDVQGQQAQQIFSRGLRLPVHKDSASQGLGGPVDDDLCSLPQRPKGGDNARIMLAALPEGLPPPAEASRDAETASDRRGSPRAAGAAGSGARGAARETYSTQGGSADPGCGTPQSHRQLEAATSNESARELESLGEIVQPSAVSVSTQFQWEWERSNGQGWKEYTRRENNRIELAWRRGASRVRLRSGAEGRTPMEVFFVDMLQQDPESLRIRRIRRVGHVPWWFTPVRCARAAMRQIRTGEPRWESFRDYQARQTAYNLQAADIHDYSSGDVGDEGVLSDFFQNREEAFRRAPVSYLCDSVVKSDAFMVTSIVASFANAVWIGVDTENHLNLPLYEKPALSITMECFFCLFFAVELVLKVMTFSPLRACWGSVWIRFDAVCVTASILEVIVWPILDFATDQSFRNGPEWTILRNVRMFRALRIFRVFVVFENAGPFFKGLLTGMHYALVVWGLLLVMLFMFGLLLRLNASQEMLDKYFWNLWGAMLTLLARGIILDEISSVIDDMIDYRDVFSFVTFAVFVFLAQFNLLNMLIGAFCSVAGDRAAEVKEADQMRHLHNHLASILDCYIAKEGRIGEREFKLIMRNADFLRTLAHAGTDMDELSMLEVQLFQRSTEVAFEDLFGAITHIRKGKAATVKDLLHIQHALRRNTAILEDMESRFPRNQPLMPPAGTRR